MISEFKYWVLYGNFPVKCPMRRSNMMNSAYIANVIWDHIKLKYTSSTSNAEINMQSIEDDNTDAGAPPAYTV